ncbi:MAG: ATPase, T2SS/T4P/T4SS family [Candidatus Omnitrophota bacterium]
MLKSRDKIGEILIKEGVITEKQLEEAIKLQKESVNYSSLGETLINLNFVKEKDIAAALSKQLNIPFFSIENGLLKPHKNTGLEQLMPEDIARQVQAVPVQKEANTLTVAFVDPTDIIALDNLKKITKCDIKSAVTTRTDWSLAIDRLYHEDKDTFREVLQEITDAVQRVENVQGFEESQEDIDKIMAQAGQPPVVRLVDAMIKQAVESSSSDIHIEPFFKKTILRYRIDGVLYEIAPPTPQLLPAMVSRIKIMAKLDIAEKRLPQDGGFTVTLANRQIDFRVSTVPTIYGEKVVIRILDRESVSLQLDDLGFEPSEIKWFKEAIYSPYGLVFITGPTGSGKTTTLYGALSEIKTPKKNIMTIEDPVEFKLEGVNQINVKPMIGLTFAAGLRAFMRQDPDIIMVGEVRDLETATICVRAALTGHLVLSTLHTNDAAGAISRLINIGVEPFLLNSSLIMLVAQRLVRKLCSNCKEPYTLASKILGLEQGITIFRPKGCDQCHGTGFKGRVAIYEVMKITEEIRELVSQGATSFALKEAAQRVGLKTLRESGLVKVQHGITSLEEVLSATFGLEEEL